MALDYLIIGLGNPGKQYEGTLHNAGFDVLDWLARQLAIGWQRSGKMALARVHWGQAPGSQIHGDAREDKLCNALLVKPQTYMNLSGQILPKLRKRYCFEVERCIVLLDNLDLETGRLRLKFGGGFSSHKGLRSLREHGGLQANFWRFFIGIGHPARHNTDNLRVTHQPVSSYVLGKPRAADAERYLNSLERAGRALLAILQGALPADLLVEVNSPDSR